MKKTNGNGTKVRRTEGEIAYAHGTQLLKHLAQEGLWEDVQCLSMTMRKLKPAKMAAVGQEVLPLEK